MRTKILSFLAASALAAPTVVHAADIESKLIASIRIGATLVDNENVDNDFAIQNFGSRIRWSGEKAFENGLSGVGYVELGLNPDNNSRGSSGADRTRQLWAGIKGGFGTVKVGAQYAAFYDMVSGHQDIAWWGSCWTQFECSRETRVLKYSGTTSAISYAASLQGNPQDEGNDVGDELEFGANYSTGNLLFGFAASMHADEGADEGGLLLGGIVKGSFGPLALGLGVQLADEYFADSNDDFMNVTLSGSAGPAYFVYNRGDSGSNNPQYGTLGYTWNIGSASLMYFEYQFVDDDSPNDEETILRATYKYDFGVI